MRQGQFKLVTCIFHRFQGKHGLFIKEKQNTKIKFPSSDFHQVYSSWWPFILKYLRTIAFMQVFYLTYTSVFLTVSQSLINTCFSYGALVILWLVGHKIPRVHVFTLTDYIYLNKKFYRGPSAIFQLTLVKYTF